MRAPAGALTALLCVGCATTQVVVKKVTDSNLPNGIRYSLPRPFLLVTPNTNGDGGFKAEVIYLPDENQTYAIDSHTRRGKYKIEVAVKDGLLTKIAWTQTDASVTAEAVRVSGEILKSELGRIKTEEGERDKQNKADQEKIAAELERLKDDLGAKELAVLLAEAEVASATEANKKENTADTRALLRAAELKLAQAALVRDAAKAALEKYSAQTGTLNGAFNDPPAAGAPTKTESATFWGPVLYAILDDGKKVSLKAVEWEPPSTQVAFETAAAPKPPEPKAEAPKLKDATPQSFTWPMGAPTHKLRLELTSAIASLQTGQRQMYKKDPKGGSMTLEPVPSFNVDLLPGGTSLEITFTQPLKGEYLLVVPFTWDQKQSSSLSIDIVANQ